MPADDRPEPVTTGCSCVQLDFFLTFHNLRKTLPKVRTPRQVIRPH